MTQHSTPRFETRRHQQWRDELVGRARDWLPEWRPRTGTGDFTAALFEIAARLQSEVAQRLDKAADKNFRGFLYWLGVRGQPGRAARLPVVFQISAGSDPVDAVAPVQLQASGAGGPIVFETESDLRLIPGSLATLVAADPASDAFYLPPVAIFSQTPPPVTPSEWRLMTSANVGDTQVQLDPQIGLDPGLILRDPASGQQYRVSAANAGIVTLTPAIAAAMPVTPGARAPRLLRVDVFDGFGAGWLNAQEHAVFLGAANALNVDTAAVIEIVNGAALGDADWRYSGAPTAAEPSGWLQLQKVVGNGRLYLLKPAGAIASVPVGTVASRWLRATSRPAAGDNPAQAFGLQLLINCQPPEGWPRQVADYVNAPAPAKISLEGIANTAPLVLDAPFYPLGTEPRLFDAFYLGCMEAFSKPTARATLSFTVDDSFGGPLAAIAFAPDNLAVGVGLDGKLRRLHQSETGVGANRLPMVEFLAPVAPSSPDGKPITLSAGPRPGAASWRNTAYVTVAAGAEIWRWSQNQAGGGGAWASLNPPVQGPPPPDPIETVLLRTPSDAGLRVYAVAAGNLYQRDAILAADWQPVPVLDQGQPVHVTKLVPVVRATASPGELYESDGLACLDRQGRLFFRGPAGSWNRIALADSLDPAVYPLIVKDAAGRLLCIAGRAMPHSAPPTPIAFDVAQQPVQAVTDTTTLVGNAVDFAVRSPNEVVAVFVGKPQGGSAGVAVWNAFGDGTLVLSAPPVGSSALTEPPLRVGDYRLFAEEKGDVGIATIDPALMQTVVGAAVTDAALFTDNARDWSHETNLLLDLTPTRPQKEVVAVTFVHRLDAASWAFELEHARAPMESPVAATIYQALHPLFRTGSRLTARRVELADTDADAQAGRQLYLTWNNRARIIPIHAIEPPVAPSVRPIAVLERDLPATAANPQYKTVDAAGDHDVVLRPIVDCGALRDRVRDALDQGFVEFPALDPIRQNVLKIIAADQRIILAAPWNRRPPAGRLFDFTAFAALSGWKNFALPRPHNPALSWEYWDGTGWWQIPGLTDNTDNLVTSGKVIFCVPANLQQTDVAGRTNDWIRARLVSGDYGQETVTILTTGPDANGVTTQQIIRSDDAIHPPYVVHLDVTYQLCCPVKPDVVLTSDNGGVRDQSAANNSDGAIVEHDVPLGAALARLAGSTQTAAAPGQAAPPDCVDCNTVQTRPLATAGPAAAVTLTANDGGRALYLGFDSKLESGPISLLFLVVDTADNDAFPLRVEVLTGRGFKAVAADDGTRGLSESGIVSFNLAESPQLTSLFGVQRYWLRLRPNLASAAAGWQPQMRGAYLNAVWVKAAETQTLQILGSSDGSPNQTATLARPPVLANSLELRVFERLDDEEVAELLRQDPGAVKDQLGPGPWPGPWVLWHETANLTDDPADARVYTLDDVSGVVTFGDGVNGRIPPTGTNVIVAVQYERVGGATANNVAAWSQLNLVTPLQGAQGVFAPDGAAGGADSQDPADTIRFAPFNISARGRAVTVTDYEQLALQFAPEIAQARALSTGTGIRLVVVIAGRDPVPCNAVQRELRLYLLERSSPMMSAPGTLVVAPPRPVPARLELALTVDAVEFSGAVSRDVLSRVDELIDPACGGHDGNGWQLGDVPSDTDIAAALADLDHLQGIDGVSLYQINDDGSETPFPATLRADQLFCLTPDGVAIEFAYAQTEVVA